MEPVSRRELIWRRGDWRAAPERDSAPGGNQTRRLV